MKFSKKIDQAMDEPVGWADPEISIEHREEHDQNFSRRFILAKSQTSKSFPGHLVPCQNAEDETVISRRRMKIWSHEKKTDATKLPAPSKFLSTSSSPGRFMRARSTNDITGLQGHDRRSQARSPDRRSQVQSAIIKSSIRSGSTCFKAMFYAGIQPSGNMGISPHIKPRRCNEAKISG